MIACDQICDRQGRTKVGFDHRRRCLQESAPLEDPIGPKGLARPIRRPNEPGEQ